MEAEVSRTSAVDDQEDGSKITSGLVAFMVISCICCIFAVFILIRTWWKEVKLLFQLRYAARLVTFPSAFRCHQDLRGCYFGAVCKQRGIDYFLDKPEIVIKPKNVEFARKIDVSNPDYVRVPDWGHLVQGDPSEPAGEYSSSTSSADSAVVEAVERRFRNASAGLGRTIAAFESSLSDAAAAQESSAPDSAEHEGIFHSASDSEMIPRIRRQRRKIKRRPRKPDEKIGQETAETATPDSVEKSPDNLESDISSSSINTSEESAGPSAVQTEDRRREKIPDISESENEVSETSGEEPQKRKKRRRRKRRKPKKKIELIPDNLGEDSI